MVPYITPVDTYSLTYPEYALLVIHIITPLHYSAPGTKDVCILHLDLLAHELQHIFAWEAFFQMGTLHSPEPVALNS